MINLVIACLGIILAKAPKSLANALCSLFGHILYYALGKRRHILLSNLHHAFPYRSETWRRKTAKKSCCRTLEMSLFVLASPYFSKKQINKFISVDPFIFEKFEDFKTNPRPALMLCPHFSMMESLMISPACYSNTIPEIGVIYRPLKFKVVESWVKKTRERFGIKLLSRSQGFNEAMAILRRNGIVGILFDQNAGHKGILTTFFNRVISATELPDLLAKRFNSEVWTIFPKRTGFWQCTLYMEQLPKPTPALPLFISANAWLENKLKSDAYCPDWLWLHNRWRTQDQVHKRFQIENRKSFLGKIGPIPRKTRFWIRMPNWLGDVVMTLPLLRALRYSRPDAEITLLVKKEYISFLQQTKLAENYISLPKTGLRYFYFFKKLKRYMPDTLFLFTNSLRSDIEAFLIKAPQRFGLERSSKKRPLLTHTWKIPTELSESNEHQTHLWEKCFIHFGLSSNINYIPFLTKKKSDKIILGLVCGTENSPEKRWPESYWKDLIALVLEHHPEVEIKLFGTQNDQKITQRITNSFSKNVSDRAGKTNLIQYIEELKECFCIICNDTGGMHLANAFGTPIVALFGPTNPMRTGPIFGGLKTILQPFNCPPTGGASMSEIKPITTYRAMLNYLNL